MPDVVSVANWVTPVLIVFGILVVSLIFMVRNKIGVGKQHPYGSYR